MNKDELNAEREKLQNHLNWLGVRSTGSDRIKLRISEIDRLLGHRQKVMRPPERLVETLQR